MLDSVFGPSASLTRNAAVSAREVMDGVALDKSARSEPSVTETSTVRDVTSAEGPRPTDNEVPNASFEQESVYFSYIQSEFSLQKSAAADRLTETDPNAALDAKLTQVYQATAIDPDPKASQFSMIV